MYRHRMFSPPEPLRNRTKGPDLPNDFFFQILAMQVQAYLMLDRLDFAKKALKQMQDIDDDSVLTQVAQAWCNIMIVSHNSKN